MYNIDNTIRYKVINVLNGKESDWFKDQKLLFKYMDSVNNKRSFCMSRNIESYREALERIKNTEGQEYIVKYTYDLRFHVIKHIFEKDILIKDNYGRIVCVYMIDNVYYNARDFRYDFINPLLYDTKYRKWNSKKRLREKDSGYRKEPVSGTGKIKGGSCYRRIRYKETLLAKDDLECSEYGIRGYRTRRVLNNWDIEAWEKGSKSWKENKRVRKQWMIHLDKKDREVQKEIDMIGMNVEE